MRRRPKRRRVTRIARARTGYLVGVLLIAVGVGIALGLGWGFVAAGAGLVAGSVWLYDVDEPDPAEVEGVHRR